MTIHLNPEQERVIGQAIQAGVIREPDDVVDVGLETIRQRLEAWLASRTAMDAEQWSQELHAWIHGHSAATPLLSDEAISRDSIYGTRGLQNGCSSGHEHPVTPFAATSPALPFSRTSAQYPPREE